MFLDPPYCYLSLIGNYVLGETFIGVCITIVVELFPARMRALAVGVYIFLIQNIGGNMEMFIPPLRLYAGSVMPSHVKPNDGLGCWSSSNNQVGQWRFSFLSKFRYHLESTYPSMSTLKGLQISLFVMFPGMYIMPAFLYVVVMLMLYCGGHHTSRNDRFV